MVARAPAHQGFPDVPPACPRRRRACLTVPTAPEQFRPIWLCTLDVDEKFGDVEVPPAPGAVSYDAARVLVRVHGRPLGQVDAPVTDGRVPGNELAQQVWRELGSALAEHLVDDGLPRPVGLTTNGVGGESR